MLMPARYPTLAPSHELFRRQRTLRGWPRQARRACSPSAIGRALRDCLPSTGSGAGKVTMSGFHKVEGFVIVVGWGVLFLWGLGLFILKREAGRLYGAVLPGIVLVVCHLLTRSLQKGPYHLFFTWGAFFIFGLTARALMTGLGAG